jgi:probable F420-dependent oxidoreductase
MAGAAVIIDGLRFGVSLLRVHPARWREVALAAEELGFESVWMSDHLVLPAALDGAAYPDDELPISPATPVFDVMVHLAALAADTTRLRLGTFVFQLALRPPFVAARAVATLDVVSGGRVELGVGAGWSRAEWQACGVPFEGRGRRLDEALEVCRRLWTEEVVEHHGEFYDFPPVMFEPKPVQRPHPPVHVGGESPAALRRAVRAGAWIGMHHTPKTAAQTVARLQAEAQTAGAAAPRVTVAAGPGPVEDTGGWRAAGVDRLIVAAWTRSRDAVEGMRRFAAQAGLRNA